MIGTTPIAPPVDIQAAAEGLETVPTVCILPERWEAFQAWLDRPAEASPGLVRLMQRKLSWER